ncbi:MAG: hypothetical protein AMJ69_06110 [Gammaproteobacteria bacterium SG8_47]|nr:MAG: hypothetical protein AMJ69_06110 [Gammaproteobacteria bacterium SG8_47]
MGLGSAGAQDNPQVVLKTNFGEIVLELYPDKAPQSVKNFLTYVDEGFYTDTAFHRVIDGFMIQGGGYSKEYKRKPTHAPIPNEANNGLKNERGTIAMARTYEPHSATSQFFINVTNNDSLNHTAPTPNGWGYAVFGKVVSGMDVVDTIRKLRTGPAGQFPSDVPQQQAFIEQAARVGDAKPSKEATQ